MLHAGRHIGAVLLEQYTLEVMADELGTVVMDDHGARFGIHINHPLRK